MDKKEFDVLIGKVIVEEATPEEEERLREAFGDDYRDEESFGDLIRTAYALELSRAMEGKKARPVPKNVEERLDQIRRSISAAKGVDDEGVIRPPVSRWRRVVRPLGAGLSKLGILKSQSVKSREGIKEGNPLFVDETTPKVLAPQGEIHFTQPLLIWKNSPGTRYDVSLSDLTSGEVRFSAENVLSPLRFARLEAVEEAQLIPGRSYRLRIAIHQEAENYRGVEFSVSPSASETVPVIGGEVNEAMEVIRKSVDSHPADALMLLFSLPSDNFLFDEVKELRLELEKSLFDASR